MKKYSKFWYYMITKRKITLPEKDALILDSIQLCSGENMNIAVCDDERVCTDLLSGYIKNCMVARDEDFNDFTIDTFASGEQLIDAYNLGKRYDLIFLDIKMKELNGFDSAKNIRTIDNKAMIVFVTSLADYIFNSFEYSPFWFLIKPVSEEKFRHVFFKALNEISKSKKGEYSFFTREYGLVTIEINNILYMESVLRKIVINTPTRQCSFYGGLTSEEQKLNKYDFIRIHKGYLVNMAHIQRINRTNVVLKNGAVLPLSEHRYKTVYDSFTSYLARC